MTGSLLVRIWIFVVAAFGLGLLVGWMFWRLHRASVPSERWRADQAELQQQRRRAERAVVERDALIGQLARARAEASRLAPLLSGAWEDRAVLRRRAAELEVMVASLRVEVQQAEARAHYLERRATELAVADGAAGRGGDERPVQQPDGRGELASPR
jgi:chromosome segregation ATPase